MRVTVFLLAASLLFPFGAISSEFRTVTTETLSTWLKNGHPVAVVDLQRPDEFREHHFDGAVSAGKGQGELARIARRLSRSKGDVVVVSEEGGDDAVRAARRLLAGGIAFGRIAILEKGMGGAVAHAAGCACCRAPGGDAK